MKHRLTLPDTDEFIGGRDYPSHSRDTLTCRTRRWLRWEIAAWCEENVKGRWTYVDAYTYRQVIGGYPIKTTKPVLCFGRKADAALFKLRWL